MRFGFVTCVRLGLSCLEEIATQGGHIDLLVTLNDNLDVNKAGRIWLDDYAHRHHASLIKCRSINDEPVAQAIRDYGIDWLFIIGWSQIARPPVLRSVTRGVLGIHPTLLPEGRGRAPIPWAIIRGLEATGVTLFKLDEGVDSGPILGQVRLPLSRRETATTLYRRVSEAHRELIRQHWQSLLHDTAHFTQQDEEKATNWPARRLDDGEILPRMSLREADALVRGTSRPYPGAFIKVPGGRLIIWAASLHSTMSALPSLAVILQDGILYIDESEFVSAH